MINKPLIAIIVPFTTYNDLVAECIWNCLQLDYPHFILILLPNENNSEVSQAANDPRICIVPTQKSNISFKRNRGFAACPEAVYYACIDSDAYPIKDWLKNALVAFKKDQKIWGVSGPNISPRYNSLRRRAVSNALKSSVVNGPRAFMKRFSEDRYANELYSCNLIIKHEAIKAVGGFDETLETGEDTEFCRRILGTGKKLYFCRDVVVYHHNRSLFLPFFKQKLIAGYSAPELLRREKCFALGLFFLPFAFLLFVFLGWLLGLIYPVFFVVWSLVMILYMGIVSLEAWRWSKAIRELPYTILSIMIGNMAPGIGTLLSLLGIPINIPRFYSNFDPQNNSN